ncbi:MAG: hypothetical protein JSV12_00975 [Candidatus Bathyarchaeota archaeon]|nr:MAG: hypothetical protein JSV12_00975 [Candidatus Bathyarchaeota archaeon]
MGSTKVELPKSKSDIFDLASIGRIGIGRIPKEWVIDNAFLRKADVGFLKQVTKIKIGYLIQTAEVELQALKDLGKALEAFR